MMSNKSDRAVKKNSGLLRTTILGSLILLVTGIFLWLMFETRCLLSNTKENIDLFAELAIENSENENQAAIELLMEHPFVVSNSVRYLPKEEAIKEFEEELGEDFVKLGIDNPLPNVVVFNLKSEYLSIDSINIFKDGLLTDSKIEAVLFQENMWVNLGANFRSLNLIALGFCILFLAVAFFTIGNTTRIMMYNDRFLIRNMELVGAKRNFIQKPYLIRAFISGLMSSGLAILGILAVQGIISNQLDQAQFCSNNNLLLLIVFFVGPFISFVSSYSAVQKYLNAEVDELYKN
jgi:cell division transport system permease protein